MVRWCLELVVERGYHSWSLENVATPAVVQLVKTIAARHPSAVAFATVDAADYGSASSRLRLIASTPCHHQEAQGAAHAQGVGGGRPCRRRAAAAHRAPPPQHE